MTFLPIVERELRIATRRRGTYRLRFWAPLTAILLWLFIMGTTAGHTAPHAMAEIIFTALGLVTLTFAFLSGVFFTADSLSVEKREGTVGLLFLTDLRGYDVVVGKLAATSLNGVYGLLTVLPVLALPVLMGGVSIGEFSRQIIVLLNTLFVSLSVGLFISAVARESRQAFMATILVLLTTGLLLPAISLMAEAMNGGRDTLMHLCWLSPYYSFGMAYDTPYHTRPGSGQFWGSVIATFCCGAICLVLACWLLPRVWQQTERATLRTEKRQYRAPIGFLQRAARLNINPCYWLSLRDSKGLRMVKIALFVLGGMWMLCYLVALAQRNTEVGFTFCFLGTFIIQIIVKLALAGEASRRFVEDRASGAMELLLGTPMPTRNVWEGQSKGLAERFRWMVFASVVPNILLLFMMFFSGSMHMSAEDAWHFGRMLALSAVLMYTDAAALRWVGMEMGLRQRKHHRAVLSTLARVILPPWVAVFLFVFVSIGGGLSSGGFAAAHVLWVIGCVTLDLCLVAAARDRIQNHFRRMASGEWQPLRFPEISAPPTKLETV